MRSKVATCLVSLEVRELTMCGKHVHIILAGKLFIANFVLYWHLGLCQCLVDCRRPCFAQFYRFCCLFVASDNCLCCRLRDIILNIAACIVFTCALGLFVIHASVLWSHYQVSCLRIVSHTGQLVIIV